MTTYAELVTQIRDYSETDSAVLTTTIINDIIANAEDKIFRNIELDCFKEYISGNTAANNRFVSLPGQTTSATTPTISDIATIRYVTLYTNSGTKELEPNFEVGCSGSARPPFAEPHRRAAPAPPPRRTAGRLPPGGPGERRRPKLQRRSRPRCSRRWRCVQSRLDRGSCAPLLHDGDDGRDASPDGGK